MISAWYFSFKGNAFDKVFMLTLAGWCIMSAVKFLPGMHERYDYLAVVLLSFVAIAYRKRTIIPAIIMNLCSNFSYGRMLTQTGEQYYPLAAIAYFRFIAGLRMNCIGRGRNSSN